MQYYSGTLKIKSPKTLTKWIKSGWFGSKLKEGRIFNIGCGRFREEPCECRKCRKTKESPLKHVLIDSGFEVLKSCYVSQKTTVFTNREL